MRTNHKNLFIGKSDEILDFERYLGLKDLGQRILRLPNNIYEAGSMGRSVALAQLIVSWSKQSTEPTLRLYFNTNNAAAFDYFSSTAHGLTAAYFSQNTRGTESQEDIRLKLLASALPRIEAMANQQLQATSKGRKIEYLFVHHAKNQFHYPFYVRTPRPEELLDRQSHGQLIGSPEQLNLFLRTCLKTIGARRSNKQWQSLEQYLGINNGPFGTLIHEIYRNTAEHAYLEQDGRIPYKGIRCFLLAFQEVSREHLQEAKLLSIPRPQAIRYFQNLSKLSLDHQRKHVGLLEVSILDSGPGFAATMSPHAVGSVEEVVASCFRKHRTAKIGSTAGMGLFRALHAIQSMGAFMRVRTSTAEAFYASSSEFHPDMDPLKYTSGGLPMISGTLITIGIPLAY